MSDFDPIAYIKEIGGVVRFGSGVLGKSAIALGILLFAVVIAVARLHADWAILAVILVGVTLFFAWLFHVLKFAKEHPDIAVLEGSEWSSFQRFRAEAKGYIPAGSEQQPEPIPGGQSLVVIGSKPADQDAKTNG